MKIAIKIKRQKSGFVNWEGEKKSPQK